MSLLLDALKKAAEKKALKNAGKSETVDATEVTDSENSVLTDTVKFEHESTQVDLNSQFAETAEMDATVIDKTEISDDATDTVLTDTVAFDLEATLVDADTQFVETTEMDATVIDKTEIIDDSTDTALIDTVAFEHEATQIDADTHFVETTEMDATVIDKTEIIDDSTDTALIDTVAFEHEATLVDANTQFVKTTEMDATVIDKAEVSDDAFDTALIDTIEFEHEKTQFDADTQFAQTTDMDATVFDKTEIDATSLDSTEIVDDSELEYQSTLDGEDRTLLIYDSDHGVDSGTDDSTDTAFERSRAQYGSRSENDEDLLTNDDVTQFMGDGISEQDANIALQHDGVGISSDDTTLTNPDSLTLTNFSFADENTSVEQETDIQVPLQDLTESDTFSLYDHDGRVMQEPTSSESLNLGYIPDDEKSTRINTDPTSTISSVDIEKLTNDETVTVGGTSSKTYAPDNYDRTLINLSEKDVSRIFPGLRPDSDTVMTPDYAKKIFLSKSGQVKTKYYKVYTSIGLILLLTVVMWGLFQLQEESDLMDIRLSSLKRDPMPGIIKIQAEKMPQSLFEPQPDTPNLKTVDIISKADDPESMSSIAGVISVERQSEQELEETVSGQYELAVITDKAVEDSEAVTLTVEQAESNKSISTATAITKAQSPEPDKTSKLTISTNTQVSQKHQLLLEAYEAYEQGDLSSARILYNKVLAIDKSDRDGILGRAAVHVQDNEYQQAIDKYQQLLVSNPKDSMAMASLISVANIDPQSGESQLKTLLRDQPGTAYLQFALGNMYGDQNRWNEAQNAYFEALKNKPEDPNYAYNLAVSLEHIGQTGVAVTFYKRALENSSKGLVTFDNQVVMLRLEVLSQ